ncbi:response regulator [Tundrisphaera lichenicola]|uniref:response regulator n=1 Tax=Tundrisphaera lichenicola TaxID=2029860 RepID=UPI003EBA1770
MSGPSEVPIPEGPAGLLLSRDLIFFSKVTGTASALGHRVIVAGNAALASAMMEKCKPKVVFVDLAAGELVAPGSIARYREITGPETPFVAFGSHVDVQALADAAKAGCDPVMPRSRFTNELPALIRRYFEG